MLNTIEEILEHDAAIKRSVIEKRQSEIDSDVAFSVKALTCKEVANILATVKSMMEQADSLENQASRLNTLSRNIRTNANVLEINLRSLLKSS